MKTLFFKFFSLILIIFVKNSKLKSEQINYKDQYEGCLNDYQMMYKMMQEKINFYSDNEKSLLDSVKSTILKTYEKTENSSQKYLIKISELEEKIRQLNINIKSKENELLSVKNLYDSKLANLNQSKNQLDREIETLSINNKLLQKELNLSKKSIEELRTKNDQCKNEIENKNEEWKIKEKEQLMKIAILNKNRSSINLNKHHQDTRQERIKDNIDSNKLMTRINRDLINDIDLAQKIRKNINLLDQKFNIKDKVSFLLTGHEEKHVTNKNNNYENGENLNKDFRFFNTSQVERFLEYQVEKNIKNNITENLKINSSVTNQNNTRAENLFDQLNIILSQTLDQSKYIFDKFEFYMKKIENLTKEKNNCEISQKKLKSENFELKEALAELEIKIRVKQKY